MTTPRGDRIPPHALSETAADVLRNYAGTECYCDDPEPGEHGIIVCTNCAMRWAADEFDALLKRKKVGR